MNKRGLPLFFFWWLSVLALLLFAHSAQAAPAFQAAGTAVSGTGSVNPAWPAHAVDDVALLFVESTGGQPATLSTPAGFAAVANSPQATGTGTNGTRITVFWARATSAAMATPRVADPGDHVYARIITYRGVINTGNPWDVTGGGVKATSSSSVTVTGVTTTVPDTRIVQVVSRSNDKSDAEFSAETNGNLTGIAERSDGGTTSGNGGGFAVWDGVKATAGATGNTTATLSRSSTNAFLTIALRPASVALDHIEIDYPAPPFSICSATPVTVYACANAACSSYYTGGATVTLSPGGNVVTIPSGSSSGSGTVLQTTAGAATLSAVSVPAVTGSPATTCKNLSNSTFSCGVTFSAASLTVAAPNLTSGDTVTGTVSGCTAQVPLGNNDIYFYTAYNNPNSGTKQATVNSTSIGTSAATSTKITLNFTSKDALTNQASFNLSYPDVGLMNLNACKPNCVTPSVSGNDPFVAAPHHFSLSNITCGDGAAYVGCIVTSPYANPGASNASGPAFMKAGNPFSITVTAYNSTGAITPNFGRETTPEGVSLTPAANMPDLAGAVAGNLTGSFGTFSNGVASGNAFSYDEAGIMTLTAKLASGNYLASGLKEITTPSSGNIGRFVPDHFNLTTNPDSPVVTRADLSQTITTVSAAAAAGATTISVASTTGFNVGSKVRIPGAGAGGAAFTATITSVGASSLTLNAGIGSALVGDGTENVISEWGSYMGEPFNAQFTLSAVNLNGNPTQNYQGAYAKLNLATAGPLGFGAVNAGTNLTARLDTSAAPTADTTTPGVFGITAPLSITRGASPDGPYAALKLGVAPVDSDGVKMGAYDLNVGGSLDHTSIMDATVQDLTEVRFGRLRLSNAYGSELLDLPIPIEIQYWSGSAFVTNALDSRSTLISSSIALGNYQKNLSSGETSVSPSSIVFTNGVGSMKLTKPGAGNNGSVDLCVDLGPDPGGGTVCSATSANMPYLQGKWPPGTNWNNDPTARATFGIYKGGPMIYMRESY